MSNKSYRDWILYFLALDAYLLGVIFIFIPLYPWWAFIALGFILSFVVPGVMGKGVSSPRRGHIGTGGASAGRSRTRTHD